MNIVWYLLIVGVVLIAVVPVVMCKIEHRRKWYNERDRRLKDWDDFCDD